MAEPIANDWKAIRARMQQIRLEESGYVVGVEVVAGYRFPVPAPGGTMCIARATHAATQMTCPLLELVKGAFRRRPSEYSPCSFGSVGFRIADTPK
jgi:hypothetical protein